MSPPTIRDATATDLAACQAIYAHWVLHGTGTFEIDPPDEGELARRREDVVSRGLPWLVAVGDAGVAGYAYANWFRPRSAYRHSIETSIYVAPSATGRGLGGLLLRELLARCEAAGSRQAVAVIGDSANAGSIALHVAFGFERVGLLEAVGWKFGRWLDVVLMQRALGDGRVAPPR